MSEALIETDSKSHKRNLSRVERDEAELRELLKQAGVTQDETEEEAVEAQPYSSEPSEPQVQAESRTKQEEEPQAEAQEEDAELSGEEKNFKKRYGDLRRHMQEKEKDFTAKLEKLEKQLESAAKNELVLPKSEEEIDAWAKKYPDIAGIVEAIAAKEADKKSSTLDARLAEIEALRSTAKREKAEAELTQIHPDFVSIREDDAFHTWADNQPKWVQDALYENTDDAKSVARVIDLYKADTGIVTKRSSTSDKAAASSVKSKRSAAPEPEDSSSYLRESQVAKMTIKEYEKRADEIMEAQRNGKFVYDLSKK